MNTIKFVSDKGWRKYPNQKAPYTGTALETKSLKEILDYCTELPNDGIKGTHGAIFTYNKPTVGCASQEYYKELSYDGILFIDIDHIPTKLVDQIFDNFDKISLASNYSIIACQKSSSYYRNAGTDDAGVHFFVASEIGDGYQYIKYATYALALVAAVINKTLGIDVRKFNRGAEQVLDTHSCKISQRLFLYHSDYRYNETIIPITKNSYDLNIDAIKKHYPELFTSEIEEFVAADTSNLSVEIISNGKMPLDYSKECVIANFLRSIGWDSEKILSTILSIDSRDRREYFSKHGQSLENHLKQIVRTSETHKNISESQKTYAIDLLFKCGINVVEVKNKKQEEHRMTTVKMDEDKWLSEYIDTIEEHIQKEQILTISAPTGTGKTTMLEQLTKKYHKNAIILVPFNVTNELYAWSNIVCSSSSNEYSQKTINTMIWDQFVKNFDKITTDIIFVDESHTLFLDRTYRDSAIEVWKKFDIWKQQNKKIVFVSATAAGEIQKTNSKILKFDKKDNRDIKVNIIFTNDTMTALSKDLYDKKYDRICVFSDRDVKLLYSKICAKGDQADAKIYHSLWPSNVKELRGKDARLVARMNLLTCIAFNGLNIKNSNEKICVSIRYTEGSTTLNEIIQIVGRFRSNKDITLNIYVDNKFKNNSSDDFDELFDNAKIITNYEDNEELKSEYYERLSDSSVQESLREIDAYEKVWTIQNIVAALRARYKVRISEKIFDKEYLVKRINPIKKEASDLMLEYLNGNISKQEFEGSYKNTDMEDFINDWYRSLNNLKYSYSDGERIMDVVLAECSKQNTLIESAINKIKRILWVIGRTDAQWATEVSNREMLKSSLKGDKMIKAAMSQFKKDDLIREQYSKYATKSTFSAYDVNIDFENLFDDMISATKSSKDETSVKKSDAAKKPRKLFRNAETGDVHTKEEWCDKLGINPNKFDYLRRNKKFEEVKNS